MDIKLVPVKSSAIASIGHNPQHSIMAVKFHNGGLHHFNHVSVAQHQALISAKSIGAHFSKHHRSGGVKVGK